MGCDRFQQLRYFLLNDAIYPYRNTWIQDDWMRIYVRRGLRYVEMQTFSALTIAAIESFYPDEGYGTEFIYYAHEINPFEITYIEIVHDERFRDFFRRHRWYERDIGGTPDFYLPSPSSIDYLHPGNRNGTNLPSEYPSPHGRT